MQNESRQRNIKIFLLEPPVRVYFIRQDGGWLDYASRSMVEKRKNWATPDGLSAAIGIKNAGTNKKKWTGNGVVTGWKR